MAEQCADDGFLPKFQRPRPLCCVCKTEYVSQANRRRCEASSAFWSPANPPHLHRPLPPLGFHAPDLALHGSMLSAQRQLHAWWSTLDLHQSSAILDRVVEIGMAVVPAPLRLCLGQSIITMADLQDPRTASTALESVEVASDAHRVMAVAGTTMRCWYIAALLRRCSVPGNWYCNKEHHL